MSFVTLTFVGFLLLVFPVYWALSHRGQNVWLAIVSLIFYGWVHPWFVVLLLVSATLDFVCAQRIEDDPGRRKLWLGLSLLGSGSLLAAFKYFDFFVENVADALAALGLHTDLHALGIIVPAGLSFYTFQTLSYTIDVYWGKLQARRNYLDYLVFVTFFPQLVAGPIERAQRLLVQVERPRIWQGEDMRAGLSLACWGALKKVMVADTVSPYVNAIYASPEPAPLLWWAAAAGFMVQILADFSGYTDIARGTARLFGFDLMRNFDHPYLAATPQQFWQRWHISFSEWLRDYVFFPVFRSPWWRRWLPMPLFSDPTQQNIARATLVTMAFSGLWHGAAWHFVLWGLFWGVVQVIQQWVGARTPAAWSRWRGALPAQILMMLGLNLVANQLFREPSVARFLSQLARAPWVASREEAIVTTVMLTFTLAGVAVLLLQTAWVRLVQPRITSSRWLMPLQVTWWCVAAWLLFLFSRQSQADFLYFQF
jgi:alginate O-acetyltransferase complex protein AlgI